MYSSAACEAAYKEWIRVLYKRFFTHGNIFTTYTLGRNQTKDVVRQNLKSVFGSVEVL